jgi:hypothetical protein
VAMNKFPFSVVFAPGEDLTTIPESFCKELASISITPLFRRTVREFHSKVQDIIFNLVPASDLIATPPMFELSHVFNQG